MPLMRQVRVAGILWALLVWIIPAGAEQIAAVKSSDAASFIGTWAFDMTEPAGTHETVRVWDANGTLSASVQNERFPPQNVSGILKDGDMLVLTATRFENGKPIHAVITLIPDGATMKFGQLLEFSTTVKRGTGKKQ